MVIGHTFPVYYGFKGGKGVATSLGVLLVTNSKIGLICLVFALVIMVITRMVSVGSIGAAVLFPILVMFAQVGWLGSNQDFLATQKSGYFIYSVLLALLIIFNHRSNIKRLMNGTENKLSFKKKEEIK
ncbi:Glycerol-3-phosphate acyltransferase [compost metagenome]